MKNLCMSISPAIAEQNGINIMVLYLSKMLVVYLLRKRELYRIYRIVQKLHVQFVISVEFLVYFCFN